MHARLKNTEDEKCHNIMTWLICKHSACLCRLLTMIKLSENRSNISNICLECCYFNTNCSLLLSAAYHWYKDSLITSNNEKQHSLLMSHVTRKPFFGVSDQVIRPAQPQRLARDLKFQIWKQEILYYQS